MPNQHKIDHNEVNKSTIIVLENKSPEELWAMNKQFFLENEEEFKTKYMDLYVAVHNGEVLGVHEEMGQLVGSLYEKYGNVPLYADKVGKKAICTINWPLIQQDGSEAIHSHPGS